MLYNAVLLPSLMAFFRLISFCFIFCYCFLGLLLNRWRSFFFLISFCQVETLVKELLQKSSDTNKFIRSLWRQYRKFAELKSVHMRCLSSKINRTAKINVYCLSYLTQFCAKIGLNVKSRSDANIALDVLAENLSVYKVTLAYPTLL